MQYSIIISSLLILFLPLLSFIGQLTIAKKLKNKAHFLSLSIIGFTLILAIYIFYNIIVGHFIYENEFVKWFTTGAFTISLGIHIDSVTSIMLCVVALISFLVHLYSTEYMKGDKRYNRYFAFLGLFTFSMNGIVLSDSLFMMYLFWELVGLSSFLLIGFWFEKDSAASAANKAFLTNRVGDIGMFIGMMILFFQTGTFHIQGITESVANGAFDLNLGFAYMCWITSFYGSCRKICSIPITYLAYQMQWKDQLL